MVILGKEITVRKMIVFLIGMMCVAMGMILFVQSSVGAEPWSLLYAGISSATGIPMGTVVQAAGIFMVSVVCLYDRRLPNPGTIMSFLIIGFFANMFGKIDFSWIGTGYIWSAAILAASILIMAFGLGIYVSADLGEGNIELLQFFLARKLKVSITVIRIIMDCTAAAIGFLLGGPLGVGTVISVFAIGPLLSFFLKFSNRYIFGKQR